MAAATAESGTQAGTASSGRPPHPGAASSFILVDGTVDYYELLGVDDIATPAEIKMAYRTLAKVRLQAAAVAAACHPR